jgi:predicted dehydrogenase
MKRLIPTLLIAVLTLMSCNQSAEKRKEPGKPVSLVTLDPGHFHAALIQKTMYGDIDSVVYVYAPESNDLQLHLGRIRSYNTRAENPTRWKEILYTGDDFFEKMIKEKKGNVVLLSGNNERKTEYILKALEAGFNVLADKPMAITPEDFQLLKRAFKIATEKKLLLYDIMTERFEITSILQKELSMIPEIFGTLQKGSPENPSVVMESRHCFYKYVSGNVLTRPAWFMDVSQEGEGIVDVSTHLVDLIQWECFPEQALDYTRDIEIVSAKRWPTQMTASRFKTITKLDSIPGFLKKDLVNDTTLAIFSNGEINYTIRDIHAKVQVQWDYTNEAGGDTHYSILRGTNTNLVIRQGKNENFKPALYIEPINNSPAFEKTLNRHFSKISSKFPGVELLKTPEGWIVKFPETLAKGHESHFADVTTHFLEYLKNKNMPAWEIPNMLAKYYTTTKGLEKALKNK